jgi:predicted dehydrogenase
MTPHAPQRSAAPTRRDFIRYSALTGAALTLGVPARRVLGANERIGVGFIGVGGRGNFHLQQVHWLMTQASEPVEIVAVCDVYRPRMAAVMEGYGAKGYMDHRELLADPRVDVVCISTPDHHHAHQALDALKAGKDVYVEKPLTHWRQFDALKQLAHAAAASDRVFQLGTQAMSDGAWHQMRQLVRDGAIGKPMLGETGFFRAGDWGEVAMAIDDPQARPGPDLNWEAFLGDAPRCDFNIDRFFRWRLFDEYAGGPATDVYPHCLTQVVDIMGLTFPELVVATGGMHRYQDAPRTVPDTCYLLAQYPEKATISVLGTEANEYQGTGQRGAGQRVPIIRGWDAAITLDGKDIVIHYPAEAKKPARRIPIEHEEDMIGHWKNFFDCCRTRNRQTFSPADLAYHVQTALIMASLAMRQGKVVRFDAAKQQIVL